MIAKEALLTNNRMQFIDKKVDWFTPQTRIGTSLRGVCFGENHTRAEEKTRMQIENF